MGLWTADSGQWTVGSGQWTVDSGQRAVDSGQRTADSGQWTADIGQWTVGSGIGQWAVDPGPGLLVSLIYLPWGIAIFSMPSTRRALPLASQIPRSGCQSVQHQHQNQGWTLMARISSWTVGCCCYCKYSSAMEDAAAWPSYVLIYSQ